ncbi:MAG: dihydrofolate reductase [Thermotogae bacterium]|nr:dihydrofolate reductase [Thermotogota bacterium]MCP5465940.1 dihydrofolate reductase [Thermotogota bacterium]HOO74308.1 dihydrofolate reductase [Tepiditoga sp.]
MKLIVAVDSDWGIGYMGKLLEKIPEDLNFFKDKTIDKIVVMGRETFESLPGRKPLKGRTNIILTKKGVDSGNVITCDSVESLFKELEKYDDEDIFIIGGASVYSQLLDYCSDAFVTKINKSHTADKYFKNLDEMNNWVLTEKSEIKNYEGTEFFFTRYINKNIKKPAF